MFALQNEYTNLNFKNIFTWLNRLNEKKKKKKIHANFHSTSDGS